MNTLQVTTINTRGLNDVVKCQSVFNLLHEAGSDIFLLQECAISYMDNYAKFEKRWVYGQSVWSGDNQNRFSGVGVLFNNRTFNIENVETVVDGRVLLVDVERCGVKFRIINVYGYTDKKERTALFQTLQPFLCSRRNIVMRGLIVPSKKELDGVRTLWIEGMGAPVC